MFASLLNGQKLQQALAHSQALDAGWKHLWQKIAENHQRIMEGLQDVYGMAQSEEVLLRQPATEVPSAASDFLELVRRAKQRHISYENKGLFDGAPTQGLSVGLHEESRKLLLADLRLELERLKEQRSRYEQDRNEVLRQSMQELQMKNDKEQLADKIRAKSLEIDQVVENIAAKRQQNAVAEGRFADFVSEFIPLLNQGGWDKELKIDLFDLEKALTVTPFQARYLHSAQAALLDNIALEKSGKIWRLSVKAGDIVHIGVKGKWSPTCALQNNYKAPPEGIQLDLSHVETGPEGFYMEYQDSSYRAKGYSSSDESSRQSSLSSHSSSSTGYHSEQALRPFKGVNPGIGPQPSGPRPGPDALMAASAMALPPPFPPKTDIFRGAQSGTSRELGSSSAHRFSSSTGRGDESRSLASFTNGLRLENTPFPEAPAGSLLLVEMGPGRRHRTEIENLYVLRIPETTYVFEKDADLYLVVNDLAGCTKVSGQLVLDLQHLVPLGQKIKPLAETMAQSLTHLKEKERGLVKQGQLSAMELAGLRGDVFNILRQKCQCDPLQYPQIVRDFFETWLEQELAQLERKIEIQREEQRLELLFIEFKSLYNDFYYTKEQSRLQQLLRSSSIRNLSSAKIRPSLVRLIHFMTEEVYPLFHLMHGKELQILEGLKVFDALIQGSLTQSFLRNLDDLVFAAGEIEAELSRAQRHTPSSSARQVGIVFPRDAQETPDELWEEPPYPRASAPLAKQVWSAIEARSKVTIALSPEQLYALSGVGTLDCMEAVPVIRSMALAFTYHSFTPPENINRYPVHLSGEMKSLLFPSENGPEYCALSSERLRFFKPKVIFGKADEIPKFFQTYASELKVAQGLSPFGVMALDFSQLKHPQYREPLQNATHASVIFELDSIFVNPEKMTWIQSCRGN
jgi:hypothetical protein